jgi:PAS domain S-box-containing protein
MGTHAVAGPHQVPGPAPVWPPCGHAECPQRDDLVLAAFDGFEAQVALLDERGVIRAVNRRWREFAARCSAGPEAGSGVGTDYLDACRRARDAGSTGGTAAIVAVERSLGGDVVETAYRRETTEGTRWLRARFVPFDSGPRRGVLLTHEDITSRQRNRDTLAALSRYAAEGVLVLDADGTVVWADDALLALTGLRREALLLRCLDARACDDVASGAVFGAIRSAFESGRVGGVGVTVPVLRDDGQVLMVAVRVDQVDGAERASVRFVATLTDVTERRQLEHAVATVADEERQSVARDVGEGVGRELTTARAAVAVAIELCEGERVARDALLQAEAAIERAAAMAHAITHGILPLKRGVPLVPALETFAENISVPGVVSVTVSNHVPLAPIGNDADQLYRICQEAVSNAIRHAHARHVSIALEPRRHGLELRVADDGAGFTPTEAVTGKGFRMMRLRASSLGGHLAIQSAVGRGTVVSCTLGD